MLRLTAVLVLTPFLTLVLAGCDSRDQGTAAATHASSPSSWEQVLADAAEMYGITAPPAVEPIREITPAESKQVIDDCLVERGWPMTDSGGFQGVDSQGEAFNLDSYICTASYPIRAEYLQPLDEDAWRRIYTYWTTETVPCLEEQGIEVPEPPTVETFLETRGWSPDGDEARAQVEQLVTQGRWSDVEHVFLEICPVSPPVEVRLGG